MTTRTQSQRPHPMTLMFRAKSPDPEIAEQANFFHLVFDIVWFGVALAATTRFLSIYAIRLGANSLELALLSSLPGLGWLITTGIASWWRQRYSDTVKSIMWPAFTMRLTFLLLALAPLLPREWQPLWLILAAALPALPQGISNALFLLLMRETVSDGRMPALLSYRMVALNVSVAAGAITFGLMLEHLPFPLNYQLMFLAAFAFTLLSQWHLFRLRIVFPITLIPGVQQHSGSGTRLWQSRSFQAVALVTLTTHIAFFSLISITPLHLVESLGADETFIMWFGMAELAAGALIAFSTTWLMRQVGSQGMLALAMLGTGASALIFATADNLPITMVGAAISGASWSAVGVGIFAFLFERVPKEDSARAATAFQLLVSLGLFVGPFVGGVLESSGLSLPTVILIGAGLRIAAGMLTRYNPVDLLSEASQEMPTRSAQPE